MNENSPICASADATASAVLSGCPSTSTIAIGRQRLADEDNRQRRHDQPRRFQQLLRIEQQPDRDEEQHGKRVAHRQGLGGRPQAEIAAAHDHAGQKRPQRHRHAEHLGRTHGNAQCHHQHGQREQLAAWVRRHAVQQPGNHPSADHEHAATSTATFSSASRAPVPTALRLARRQTGPAAAPAPAR